MDEGFIQLKWNAHQLVFLDSLSTLRDKQVYTDVTLSCGDHFYPAHRLVLSACSTFFARSLEITTCRAPVLLLHGIEQSTLEQLLMFIYDGQVTISREDLPKLLKAAQWLEVKGLDTTQDQHMTNNPPAEDSNSTQDMQNWPHFLSSYNNTNMQQENPESEVKVFKNITSMVHKDAYCDKNLDWESPLSEEQSNQESSTHAVTSDTDIATSVESPADSDGLDNCTPAQQSDESSRSYSFKGWSDNETCQNYDVKDVTIHEVSIEDNENISCSPDESAEATASKENSAAGDTKRSLKCKHCKRSFNVRKDLAKHLRYHHDQTHLNYCISCHSKFVNKKQFQSHLKMHQADKVHSCTMCEFVTHSPYGLKQHVTVLHPSTPSVSDVLVPKVELVEESTKNSKAPSTNFNSKRITCPICSIEFKNKFIFKKHENKGCKGISKSKKGYHCPFCNYVSSRLRSVEDHLGSHTGDYRFCCTYCPYKCTRRNILQLHINKRHPEHI